MYRSCINRIRLEFKEESLSRSRMFSPCINRIRLEFKVVCTSFLNRIFMIVLIESDWNLKSCQFIFHDKGYSRINRIRLEFKADSLGNRLLGTSEY